MEITDVVSKQRPGPSMQYKFRSGALTIVNVNRQIIKMSKQSTFYICCERGMFYLVYTQVVSLMNLSKHYCNIANYLSVTRHRGIWRAEIWTMSRVTQHDWRKVSMWHTSKLGNFTSIFDFSTLCSRLCCLFSSFGIPRFQILPKYTADLQKIW